MVYLYNRIELKNELLEIRHSNKHVEVEEPFKLSDIKTMGGNFIVYCVFIVFSFVSFLPYSANLNSLLQTRFSLSPIQAGDLIA